MQLLYWNIRFFEPSEDPEIPELIVWDVDVAGSNPVVPTIDFCRQTFKTSKTSAMEARWPRRSSSSDFCTFFRIQLRRKVSPFISFVIEQQADLIAEPAVPGILVITTVPVLTDVE